MKRLILLLFALAFIAGGCMNPHLFSAKDTESQSTSKRPTIVYSHQVEDSNAAAMAKALEAEMQFDARKD